MTPEKFLDRVTAGSVEEVALALEAHPELAGSRNENGVSALLTALYHRRPEVADLLSPHLALDVHEAAALGDLEALKSRLDEHPGAHLALSPDGFTPLHLAAFFSRVEAARLLLARGASPLATAENPTRVQPLHSATAARSLELVKLLLEAGADVNARQQGGWTPLHAAARHGDESLVRQLLEAGADVSLPADEGSTAATLAGDAGHIAVAALLTSSPAE